MNEPKKKPEYVQRMFDYLTSPKFGEDFRNSLAEEQAQGVIFRRDLVEQINAIQGIPGADGQDFQTRFIDGQMGVDESIAYRYHCEDVIRSAADQKIGRS